MNPLMKQTPMSEMYEDLGAFNAKRNERGDPWAKPVFTDREGELGRLMQNNRMNPLAFHVLSVEGLSEDTIVEYPSKSGGMGVIDLVIPGKKIYRWYKGKIFIRKF